MLGGPYTGVRWSPKELTKMSRMANDKRFSIAPSLFLVMLSFLSLLYFFFLPPPAAGYNLGSDLSSRRVIGMLLVVCEPVMIQKRIVSSILKK